MASMCAVNVAAMADAMDKAVAEIRKTNEFSFAADRLAAWREMLLETAIQPVEFEAPIK